MKQILWFTRVSLFIVYFWFGLLKIVGLSPAEPLVHYLFNVTLSHLLSFQTFLIIFGIIECFIGIIWLFPKLSEVAYFVVIFHLVLTVIPMVALPEITWTGAFIPTLVGQYIIKNLLLISSAMFVTRSYKMYGVKLG
jgi:uncharacterized membrane protein YkgB